MAQEIPGTHFVGEVAQKVLIEKDGKILMCRGKGFSNYDLPGGRVHKGETPEEGLRREIKEELGVDIQIGEAFHFHVTEETYSGIPRYILVFRATLLNQSQPLTPAEDEIQEIRWVGKEDAKVIPTWDSWRELLYGRFGINEKNS